MAWNYQPYQQNQVFMQQPQAPQNQSVPDRLEQMRQQQYAQPMQNQPIMQNQQPMPQPAVNQPMQFYPVGQIQQSYQPMQQSSLLKVLSEAEAQAYLVVPGASVVMMDAQKPKIYIKSVDMNNNPHFEKYRLVEEVDEPESVPQMEDLGGKFVTREEYERLREEHEKMLTAIANIARRMEVNADAESDS